MNIDSYLYYPYGHMIPGIRAKGSILSICYMIDIYTGKKRPFKALNRHSAIVQDAYQILNYLLILFSTAQSTSPCRLGIRLSPVGVRQYSTRGGTSG